MSALHFCRDGILRRSMRTCIDNGKNWTTSRLPVQAWEASVDRNIFLKTLNDPVIFEDGLTVGELFDNLGPWAEQMTGVACMDFPAALDEIRSEAKPDNDLAEIILEYNVFIKVVPAYDRNKFEEIDDDDSETGRFFRFIGKPMKTGRLEVESRWSMSAMLRPEHRHKFDGEKSVSLSFTALNKWQHLPITFKPTADMHDETAYDGNTAIFLGTDQSLTRADHQNVEVVLSPNGAVMGHRIPIDPPMMPTFHDAVVRGFLWDVGFFYSPAQRDKKRDEVMESLAELDRRKGIAEMSDDDIAEMSNDDIAEISDVAEPEARTEARDEGPSGEEQAKHEMERLFLEKIKSTATQMGLHVEPDKPDVPDCSEPSIEPS